MPQNDLIDVCAEVIAETDKAFFMTDSGDKDDGVWIPKSIIENLKPKNPDRGDTVEFELPEWLAKDKELI